MDGMEMPVIIIVKAPNQQIEDQMVRCELSWTIKKLKGYLSEVYPSKPRTEDQKLIYSGQLLQDAVTLKDVLRSYEGQENHTVHLVCSPGKTAATPTKSPKATAVMQSQQPTRRPEPESEERTMVNESSSTSELDREDSVLRQRANWALQCPPYSYPYHYSYATAGGTTPQQYDAVQQMAYWQQAYAQYVSQYMSMMSSGAIAPGSYYPGTLTPLVPPQTTGPPPPAMQDPPPANNNNAQDGEDEDGRGNRDWLDWFYIMSRLLVLFSIVYFYSSPVRFFVVSTLGIIMYLYQTGFFRGIAPPVGENNNAGLGGEGARRQPNLQRGAANNNEALPREAEEPQPEMERRPSEPAVDRPGLLTLTWTMVSSFFLSLIPEQPNNIL